MHWNPLHYVFLLLILQLYVSFSQFSKASPNTPLAAEKTRAVALLFSYIQCFPSNLSAMDGPSQQLFRIHQTFNPKRHLNEYKIRADIKTLVAFVDELKINGTPNDLPFTNSPTDIGHMITILKVLYHNANNWSLFYRTAAWLLQRVNTAQFWWALKIALLEKFSDVITTPSSVETFPQFFAPKEFVLAAAGLKGVPQKTSPLQYWISDPNLNEFHAQWHMQNPFWWNDTTWGVNRDRKGELFLYMHHQILARYKAEWQSIGLKGQVEPLGLQDDDRLPEGYIPDVVNADYQDFFSRENNQRIGDYGTTLLGSLRVFYGRMIQGIERGYFLGSGGNKVPLRGFNGTDIVGATTESSVKSANSDFYGSFHNFLHQLLSGVAKPEEFPIPGLQAHQETSMRDPVFYRLHGRVDEIYRKYKSTTKAYTQSDLDFAGVSVQSVTIQRCRRTKEGVECNKGDYKVDGDLQGCSAVLTTYFRTVRFDISTAARPCRAVNDRPITAPVKILDHDPFSYKIVLVSERPLVSYGMVRIFLWPEFQGNGTRLVGDAAHSTAIELDIFRVRLNPYDTTVITRSSLNSSVAHRTPSPGIKQLSSVQRNSELVSHPRIQRACGFPNNLLIPRGTKNGMSFKLVVYVSDETGAGDLAEQEDDSHFPYCGVVNGKRYPDKRSMGFPFDRPGTKFMAKGEALINNVKEIKVLIKHRE